MIDTSIVGDTHLITPFVIGQIQPEKGYVHVFDDTTLDIVMSTLDTISDFTAYLTKKERFLTGEIVVHAAGEGMELLAIYLQKLNKHREHDFIINGHFKMVSFEEGFWKVFVESPERQAQIESDRISYAWDELIEKFAFHIKTGTQHYRSRETVREQEIMFRVLAREPRTQRRMLATNLHEVVAKEHKATYSQPEYRERLAPTLLTMFSFF